MMGNKKKLNEAKTAAFVLTLLLVGYMALLTVVTAGAGAPSEEGPVSGFGNIPGLPDNAVQYNKTDITPVAQMEQVMAGEPALFCYRNMTMLMNCSQNCEVVFTADPAVTPKIFGFSIDPNQTMALTMNLSGSPFEGERVMERALNFYLGIEPNATIQLNAQIRLHINQTELRQELNREVNTSRLTWMYWDQIQAEWKPVESYMDQNGYLVCNTDHFSTWTVAEIDDAEEALQFGLNLAYIYAGISVIVVVVLAVGIVAFKKRS